MSALAYKQPCTPAQRHTKLVKFLNLWRGKSVKTHSIGIINSSYRNNTGRITVHHHGGGVKQKLRVISLNFLENSPTFVLRIEYDPIRSAHIALICQLNTNFVSLSYILASRGLSSGMYLELGNTSYITSGNILSLKNIPIGAMLHSICDSVGIKYIRAAGTYGQIIARVTATTVSIKLPSGEKRLFGSYNLGTLGSVSNINRNEIKLGKAGRSRWLNKRPAVRGIAMNPIDHPHGGGQGKTGTGRHPVTPWGFLTKGKRTRSIKKKNTLIIKFRYQK